MRPSQQTSAEVHQLACSLALFVPFATVATLLQRMFSLSVSTRAVWHWVQAALQRAMDGLNAELAQLEQGNPPAEEPMDDQTRAQPLIIGAGVMVPFRPADGSPKGKTRWREIKVAILTHLGHRTARSGDPLARLERRRVVAVLGDMEALRPRLWVEAVGQGVAHSPTVVWLSDGARGLSPLFETLFAACAIGILDFFHMAQNLWQVLDTCLAGRRGDAQDVFAAMRHDLRHGQGEEVLDELIAARDVEGLAPPRGATLTTLCAYLERHREHLDYQRFKDLGLPIGSGMVESACKWLIQQRFKGVGMRWSEEGFNHLLHLRLFWVNGRFDDLFPSSSPN